MTTPLRILLVDDDADDRALAALVLLREIPDCELDEAADPLRFAEQMARGEYAVVIAEYRLGWSDGLRVLESARERWPDCSTVLFGSLSADEHALQVSWPHLDAFVKKSSAGFLALPRMVRRSLETAARRRERSANGRPFRVLQERLPVGIVALRPDGTVNEANPATARILGLASADEVVGRDLGPMFVEAQARRRWREALAGASSITDLETRLECAGGAPVWVRVNLHPVYGVDGTVLRFEAAIDDVSQHKGTEAELRRQAETLHRYNDELEQLSYAVSHDLQEPLQLVSRYARLLAERYQSAFDADATRYLENLIDGARRMQGLVDAVLEYSRIGSGEQAFAPADFGAVLDEALENLKGVLEEAQAEVRRDPLPTLPADERQMVQLFQNLIGNAVKFRGPVPLRVRIGAREREHDWLFSVRDNGIGMEPQYAQRIFGMFQRLHTAEEYGGTGIGLALCKKIAERHGGGIWVRSQPNKGSTFFVSVPKEPGGVSSPASTSADGVDGEP